MKCKIKLLQEYEKELKKAKAAPRPPPAQEKSPVNMLESSYSRTFIFASNNSSKKINVKQVYKYISGVTIYQLNSFPAGEQS